ncbi:MAG TPA: YHYH protein [Verrucomicrobiae bacterium]|jgi:hypothetical protein
MKINPSPKLKFIAALTLAGGFAVHADPLLTSWFTANSGKYARVYTTTANRTNGVSATTWSGQTSPTYAGVHEIDYSTNWVYIRNTGLASYVMGPWSNPNWAKNQGTATSVYRFPRGNAGVTNTAAAKTLTPLAAIGHLVDGVSIDNQSDSFSYSVSHAEDASPAAGIGSGDGIWNRDALPNEGVSFDYALNHPQQNGDYHSHANPIGVRYLLGDNVNYDSSTKIYSENTSTTVFKHSPIVGWLSDGIPLYGPYGYSDPANPASTVRRMISGYVLRNGQCGTTNLGITGRTSLPAWGALAQGRSAILSASQYGPNTNATYALGHYQEDYDYLGDHGYDRGITNGDGTFYDLNQYNARWCVTPEYPGGTWAYFVSIKADGTSWYPYNVGRWYLDTPTGGATTTSVMNSDTPLALYFKGATNLQEVLSAPTVNKTSGNVTLAWSALEGGTYQVNVSSNLTAWTTNTALTTTATNNSVSKIETNSATANMQRFYRTARTSVAAFDSAGY